MRQEMLRLWDAVASAGQYANNLHLAPDRKPPPSTWSLNFAGWFLFRMPNEQRQSTEGIDQVRNILLSYSFSLMSLCLITLCLKFFYFQYLFITYTHLTALFSGTASLHLAPDR